MKILLTNRELVHLGGSELVTVELAEEMMRQGHEVTIYSPRIGGGALDTSHLCTTTSEPDTSAFDLLWIHHNLLIHRLGFKKRPGQRIVFNHMSSWVPLEWPRLPGYEMQLADLVLANSPETRDKLVSLGLSRVELFQNPAPIAFDGVGGGREYALFISNHRPEELEREAARLDIPIRFIGKGHEEVRVTPAALAGARFVVANGKSVQYAMRAGVPVFLYDSFGGPGWGAMSGEYWNFSGRGAERVAPSLMHSFEMRSAPACPARFKLEVVLAALGVTC